MLFILGNHVSMKECEICQKFLDWLMVISYLRHNVYSPQSSFTSYWLDSEISQDDVDEIWRHMKVTI